MTNQCFKVGEMSSPAEQIRWHVITNCSYSSPEGTGQFANRSPDLQSTMHYQVIQNEVFPSRERSFCGLELMKSPLLHTFSGQCLYGQSSLLCLSGKGISRLIPAPVELSCQPVCWNKLRASKLWLAQASNKEVKKERSILCSAECWDICQDQVQFFL